MGDCHITTRMLDIQCPMNMTSFLKCTLRFFGPHASEYGRRPWRSTRDGPSGLHVHEKNVRDEFLI